MNKSTISSVILILLLSVNLLGQNKVSERADLRIMFYNTENLFDTIDDPLTNDSEFLPGAQSHWNRTKYYKKLKSIYQTIAAVGEEIPPEIIGFAEIENKIVLNDLIFRTPLDKYSYKIIHKESPDQRGIDVALIYRSDLVKCIGYDFITIRFPGNKDRTTRDILYFKALINNDTLHVFVNHWPSRRGGQKKSDPSRIFVARLLKHKIDSLFIINPEANIALTGDFNDEPQNVSLSSALGAVRYTGQIMPKTLYNLSWDRKNNCKCGTYRFGNNWEMLDQFIVSGSLLSQGNLSTCAECYHIGEFKFLLKEDNKYGGYRPFRTYQGPAYKGGFSDHLPVYLDIFFKHSN